MNLPPRSPPNSANCWRSIPLRDARTPARCAPRPRACNGDVAHHRAHPVQPAVQLTHVPRLRGAAPCARRCALTPCCCSPRPESEALTRRVCTRSDLRAVREGAQDAEPADSRHHIRYRRPVQLSRPAPRSLLLGVSCRCRALLQPALATASSSYSSSSTAAAIATAAT